MDFARTRGIWIAISAGVALAGPADGATLTLNGGGVFQVGEPIVLTLDATLAKAELVGTAFVGLENSDSGVASFQGATQVALTALDPDPVGPFTTFPLACPNTVDPECVVVNQIAFNLLVGLPADAFDGTISTIELLALAPGVTTVSVFADEIDFAGVTQVAPVEITVVPEPPLTALLALAALGVRFVGGRR